MTTVTIRVAASADDVLRYGAVLDSTTDNSYIGNDGAWNDNGFRFVLNVPAGATIISATLTFRASLSLSTDTVRTKISYQDINEPPDFSGDTPATFDARVRSVDAYDWDFTTDWTSSSDYDTGNFASVIQALVNEAYWTSGEHCVLFVDDDGSDTNAYRRARSYDFDSLVAPLLTVEYTIGGIAPLALNHFRRLREQG